MREISVRGVRSLGRGPGADLRQGRLSATKTRIAPCHPRAATPRQHPAATCGGGPILSRPARRYVARHPSTRMGTGTDVADALYERE